MALAQLIDASNYSTMLKQSTQGRAGTPDGNIYFDDATNSVQIITREELAQVDLGSGLEDNPLTNADGITMQALYLFENQERRVDETLRKFYRNTGGVYKFAGAFVLNRGAKLAGSDRTKIRQSGWIEYNGDRTNIDRIYFGVRSLVAIQPTSQAYYALVTGTTEADLLAATWTDFGRVGPIDEAVQVYGDTAFGDVGAGDFDYTLRTMVVRLRPFGAEHVENTSVDNGVTEFSGFSAGFGIGETDNAFNSYNLADVYGGAQIAPWTGMSLHKLTGFSSGALALNIVATAGTITRATGDFTADGFTAGMPITTANFTNAGNNGYFVIQSVTALVITVVDNTGMVDETGTGDETVTSTAQAETGFNEADGNFTWVLRNTANGTVDQCAAFLDALQLQDADIDSEAGTYNGRKGRLWYTRNAQGKVVTNSISGQGLFIEGLSTAEKQNIIMTDDAAAQKTYPFFPEIRISVGAQAVADTNAWYHVYYVDGAGAADFDAVGAVTVRDSSLVEVKGNVSTDAVANIISFDYAYDTDTDAGLTAGTDKDCVVLVEGDGGVAQAIAFFTITRDTIINVSAVPAAETNA